MLAIEALAAELPMYPANQMIGEQICCVTGKLSQSVVLRADVFSSVFSTQGELAAPYSQYVDARIADVLANGYLRWSTWIMVDGRLEVCKRARIRQLLGEEPSDIWAAYAAEDMRRHGGLLTVCNRGYDSSSLVQIGQSRASAVEAMRLFPIAIDLADAGAKRTEIATLEFSRSSIHKVGVASIARAKRMVASMDASPEWRLACWLLPTKEDKDAASAALEDNVSS